MKNVLIVAQPGPVHIDQRTALKTHYKRPQDWINTKESNKNDRWR